MSLAEHDKLIHQWEEKCKELEGRISYLDKELHEERDKVRGLEKKSMDLEIIISTMKTDAGAKEGEIAECRSRIEFLEGECTDWDKKYHDLEKSKFEVADKFHHAKVAVVHLRKECHRIREMAHYRVHKLAEKVKHFCSLEKECRCILEKFEGLCHVEDIMREEIVFEEVVKN